MAIETGTVDVALVVALKEEFRELQLGAKLLLSEHQQESTDTYHHFGFVDHEGHTRRGVAQFIDDVGIAGAQVATDRLIGTFKPALVVNIGISGTLSDDVRIGDVVVPTNVQDYSQHLKAGRSPQDDTDTLAAIGLGGPGFPTDNELVELLTKSEFSAPGRYLEWQKDCFQRITSALVRAELDRLSDARLVRATPQLSTGIAAAGDFVVKSKAFKSRLVSTNVNYVACDMESAGVLAAVYDRPRDEQPRVLVIRGISDPSDERKKDLETIKEGLLRRWSITNAYHILSLLLRRLPFDKRSTTTTGGSTLPQRDVADVAEEMHSHVTRLYMRKDPLATFSTAAVAFAQYAKVFHPLVLFEGQVADVDNPFDVVVAKIIKSTSSTPLQVDGPPGSGKSLFLSLLYLLLRRAHTNDPSAPIPIFIDLARYDELVYSGSAEQLERAAANQVSNELEPLTGLIRKSKGQKFVVIVDGFMEYRAFQRIAEKEVLSFCDSHQCVQKIVAVRLDGPQSELEARWDPEDVIVLSCLPTSSPDVLRSFFGNYLATLPRPSVSVDELLHQVNAFRLSEIDLYTTALLSKTSTKSLKKIGSLSQFYTQLCKEHLHHHAGTHTIEDAAELAFSTTIERRTMPADELHSQRAVWTLIHQHSNIRDFLVAQHLVNEIVRFAQSSEKDVGGALRYVFPAQITRFSKEIVNLSTETKNHVLAAARKATTIEGGARLQTVLSYLLGRFEGAPWTARARECLDTHKLAVEKNLRPTDKSTMLLARTIYISLVYLGSVEASVAYTSKLLSDPAWDSINRGFHLEYYGDIPYDPGSTDPLSNEDLLGPFPRTFLQLSRRLRRNMAVRSYPLFDVELHTLCSLAQHRHAQGKLSEQERTELIELLRKIGTTGRELGGDMPQYVKMAAEHLALSHFRVGMYAERLNAMKTNKRMGWIRRGLKNVESIADHSLSAYLIGLFYLPEQSSERGYDKHAILDMILVHDLAEAFTGDIPAGERTDDSVVQERQWFSRIALLSPHRGMANLKTVRDRWEEFERGVGTNARVARELDKIENLVQLYIYAKTESIGDYEEWARGLRGEVQSPEGRRVLDTIDAHFLGDQG